MTWRLLNASSWRVRPGGAIGGLHDLLRVGAPLVSVREVLDEHLGVAVDGHQQIVEVVRDAAGEPSDRLHLLRLPQLLLALLQRVLRLLALDDVAHDGGKRRAFAALQRRERKLARESGCRPCGGRSLR